MKFHIAARRNSERCLEAPREVRLVGEGGVQSDMGNRPLSKLIARPLQPPHH